VEGGRHRSHEVYPQALEADTREGGAIAADEIMQTPQSGLALNSKPIGSSGRDVG